MLIKLSPVRTDNRYSLSVSEDIVTIDGESFDLTPLVDGGTLPFSAISSPWFVDQVDRIEGSLVLTLILPHGSNAPESTRFPIPITVIGNGPVELPPYNEVVEDEYRLAPDDHAGAEGSAEGTGTDLTSDPRDPEPEAGS